MNKTPYLHLEVILSLCHLLGVSASRFWARGRSPAGSAADAAPSHAPVRGEATQSPVEATPAKRTSSWGCRHMKHTLSFLLKRCLSFQSAQGPSQSVITAQGVGCRLGSRETHTGCSSRYPLQGSPGARRLPGTCLKAPGSRTAGSRGPWWRTRGRAVFTVREDAGDAAAARFLRAADPSLRTPPPACGRTRALLWPGSSDPAPEPGPVGQRGKGGPETRGACPRPQSRPAVEVGPGSLALCILPDPQPCALMP